jgi:hypothetical protein
LIIDQSLPSDTPDRIFSPRLVVYAIRHSLTIPEIELAKVTLWTLRLMAPATGYVPIEVNAEEEKRANTRRAPRIAKRTLVKDYHTYLVKTYKR